MADISKCADNKCPSNFDCYRYMAPINELWQSYIVPERKKNEDKCEHFWPLADRKDKK